MTWKELDLDFGTWKLAANRTKNSCAHVVDLSPLAIQLITSLQPLNGHFEYVFQSDRTDGPIHYDSLTRAVSRFQELPKDKQEEHPLCGWERFTVHDLRRTAATCWGEHLKVQPHVIERMLNHQPKDKLIQTYQRASYRKEQRQAWLDWGGVY